MLIPPITIRKQPLWQYPSSILGKIIHLSPLLKKSLIKKLQQPREYFTLKINKGDLNLIIER